MFKPLGSRNANRIIVFGENLSPTPKAYKKKNQVEEPVLWGLFSDENNFLAIHYDPLDNQEEVERLYVHAEWNGLKMVFLMFSFELLAIQMIWEQTKINSPYRIFSRVMSFVKSSYEASEE